MFKACRTEMEAPVHARNNVAVLVRSAEVHREKLCNARELQLTHNGQQRHGWLKNDWMENESRSRPSHQGTLELKRDPATASTNSRATVRVEIYAS